MYVDLDFKLEMNTSIIFMTKEFHFDVIVYYQDKSNLTSVF